MTSHELIDKSIYIITEYYQNNLQPFFDHLSEDILWLGPADGQELRGRETIISTFSAEKHKLTFTMGSIRAICISQNESAREIILQYEIYTHYPNGRSDFHNQRIQYSWYENKRQAKGDAASRWEISMIHISNAWHYDNQDTIYPIHYKMSTQYVYDSCDYFVHLDAENNSYTMIRGQIGTFLLPEVSTNYEQDMMYYANTFIAEEDREMLIREMRLARILEQIEQQGVHSFTYGIIDSKRGYTRKRLDYRYHDRKNKIILMTRTDITDIYFEEEKKRQELEQALMRAQTDSLTKLLNVQAISDKIREHLADESRIFALYFIDLDDFKSINDRYGHPVGDSVFRNIANALRTIQGEKDSIGRVGGDEFVYFAPVLDRKHAAEIAQRICYAIQSVKISNSTRRRVTGSVGIALAPEDGQDYDALVRKADESLYEAKKAGKNQYLF